MAQVDRYLEDKAMDCIDHALGRPLDPLGETYRNHYAIDANSQKATEMRASPHWDEGGTASRMAFFHVTDDGRRALAEHLRAIGDPHRAFILAFDGHEAEVVSTSPAKARYAYWLRVSDSWPDLKFSDFFRSSKVRRAA